MRVPILSGVYADPVGDFRTAYPRNMVPVPKATGFGAGYLRPAEGIATFAEGGGKDRGGYEWRGVLYRVMGENLCRVAENGVVTVIGQVGGSAPATMDAGFDVLAIWAGGKLHYWDGFSMETVNDADLTAVIDGCHLAGYFLSTDGEFVIATDIDNRREVNPLKYGSAEADPDGIVGIAAQRSELLVFGRHSVEFFALTGGTGFPFVRIPGGYIPRGPVGTWAFSPFGDTFAFVGSGRNEALGVYALSSGGTVKLSTREVDLVLAEYGEAKLSDCIVEAMRDGGHDQLRIHLPDQTLVYDAAASAAMQRQVWFTLTSSLVGRGQYRARGLTHVYGKWIAGDPTTSKLGALVNTAMTHHGQPVGWDFGTSIIYNDGRGAIIGNMELVGILSGTASEGVIWTSYSRDGLTWSHERAAKTGGAGDRERRVCWRNNGKISHYRAQRFRGTSESRMAVAALEVEVEPLYE